MSTHCQYRLWFSLYIFVHGPPARSAAARSKHLETFLRGYNTFTSHFQNIALFSEIITRLLSALAGLLTGLSSGSLKRAIRSASMAQPDISSILAALGMSSTLEHFILRFD